MSDAFLFTISLGITVLGMLASWAAYKRRGAGAGLRGAAWSTVPLAAYLTGVEKFVKDLVFSPVKWTGVALLGLGVVLYLVSGVMLRRRTVEEPKQKTVQKERAPKGEVPAAGDPELAEIEQILRNRGIS